MQDYLAKYPKIDAVWANDDDMLLGVIEAVDRAGRKDIKYALGGNGMKQVIEMVKEGNERTPVSTPLSAVDDQVGHLYDSGTIRWSGAYARFVPARCTAYHSGERRPILLPRFPILSLTRPNGRASIKHESGVRKNMWGFPRHSASQLI